jgi:hypothetical protein
MAAFAVSMDDPPPNDTTAPNGPSSFRNRAASRNVVLVGSTCTSEYVTGSNPALCRDLTYCGRRAGAGISVARKKCMAANKNNLLWEGSGGVYKCRGKAVNG